MPILVTSADSAALGEPGTLLGLFDDITVCPRSFDLAPGDVVVFHTDGATDVPPPYDLDERQWLDLVTKAARQGGSADDIAEQIRASLEAILPFRSRDDDIALLVLAVEARDSAPAGSARR